MDATNFLSMLEELQSLSKSRDPRSVRLSAVYSALSGVIQDEGHDVSAIRIYAKAVETLEGTLHQQHQDFNRLADSLLTQACLVEILHLVLPYIDPDTVVAAAFPASRAIRGVVKSTLPLDDVRLETNDNLDLVSLLLCHVSKTSASLVTRLTKATVEMDGSLIRTLLKGSLLILFHANRRLASKAAKEEIFSLLNASDSHPVIVNAVTSMVVADLELVQSGSATKETLRSCLDTLKFLRISILKLEFERIGEIMMVIMFNLFNNHLNPHPEAGFVDKSQTIGQYEPMLVNEILSTFSSVLKEETNSVQADVLSARVLATLLQTSPGLLLITKERSVSVRLQVEYTQVMLTSAQRLLRRDIEKGCKLLPLTISHLLKLLSNQRGEDGRALVSERMFSHVANILQVELASIKARDMTHHDECCKDCLAVMRPLLEASWEWSWGGSLKTLVLLLLQMKSDDASASECILSLVRLRTMVERQSPQFLSVEEAISCLVQGLGIEQFWTRIDFPSYCRAEYHTGRSSSILKSMRVSSCLVEGKGPRLAFFQEKVLSLARSFDMQSTENPLESRQLNALVLDLWSLFPCFCTKPVDIAASIPSLSPVLVKAMCDRRYPQLMAVAALGINLLAKDMKDLSDASDLGTGPITTSQANDLQSFTECSEMLLLSLFRCVHDLFDANASISTSTEYLSTTSIGGSQVSSHIDVLTTTIASVAKLAPASCLRKLFARVVQSLLEASQTDFDSSLRMCSLLSLSHSLLISGGLDEKSILLLYRSLKPLIRTDETRPQVQKRAYKLLGELCSSKAFVMSNDRLAELTELLTSTSHVSQIAARSSRLRCLQELAVSLRGTAGVEEWIIAAFLGEALLCLKDSNKRTRDIAYRLLLSLGELLCDNVILIQSITAAMASETTHMRSAAVMALSKVVHHYGSTDERLQQTFPSLLKTVLLLLDDASREVCKSVVGFVRIFVSVCSRGVLQELVPDILGGLLKHRRGKDRFRAKIKIIMKKLIRLYGLDYLLPMVPPSEERLLLHLRKVSEREIRLRNSITEEGTSEGFDYMLTSDEEDSDDGLSVATALTKSRKTTETQTSSENPKRPRSRNENVGTESVHFADSVQIRNDPNYDDFDVRDLTKTIVNPTEKNAESDSEHEMEFDDSGRLVVKLKIHESPLVESNTMPSHLPGRHSGVSSTSSKQREMQVNLGAAYKARKAGGDVKRKGQKLDPYAYVPLDSRNYTRKKRKVALEQMNSVVKGRKRQRR